IPRLVRVASVVPECARSARRRFWIMSHQVQLSPAASHCPTAVLDPAGHAAEPPACRSRCPYSPAGHAPDTVPPGIRSARPSFTPPPKIPGRARDRHGRTGPRGPARPDSREEGSGARTLRPTDAPHYLPGQPSSDLPARLMTAIDLRVLRRYLPSTSRRPAPPAGAGQPKRPRRRSDSADESAFTD